VRLISRGEPAEALRILTVLTAEQPDDAIARAYLGLSLLRLHRVADAREALELAVSMAPESFICRTKYAEFLARLGFFDQALAHLDIALNGEAPDAVAEMAARELRTFCKEKGKGIFYRPTASPTRLRLGNFLPRRRSANGSIQTTPGSAQ
jgi:tetratricopeptide (TPR) repeat protein